MGQKVQISPGCISQIRTNAILGNSVARPFTSSFSSVSVGCSWASSNIKDLSLLKSGLTMSSLIGMVLSIETQGSGSTRFRNLRNLDIHSLERNPPKLLFYSELENLVFLARGLCKYKSRWNSEMDM